MQKRVNNALLMGMIGSMLAACGGGSDGPQDSLNNASQKHYVRSAKASLPACDAAWVSATAYTGGATVS